MSEAGTQSHIEFRPAWKAFGVYWFGALLFAVGPLVNPEAIIRPALSELLCTCLLAFIFLKRYTSLYQLSAGQVVAQSSFPSYRRREADIGQIVRIDLRRGLIQRLLGVAHVHIYLEDQAEPAVKLFGVDNPDRFRTLLLEMGARDQRVTGAWRR